MSSFLIPISLLIGFFDIGKRLELYIKRKDLRVSVMDDSNSISLWDKIRRNERTRLVLAYIVIPCFSLFVEYGIDALNSFSFPFVVLFMLFVYVPPTVIRFVVKVQGIEYMSSIFAYVLLSAFVTCGISYMIYSFPGLPSFWEIVSIYLILSYKSKREKSSFKLLNHPIWFWYILLMGLRYNLRHGLTGLEAYISTAIAGFMILLISLLFRSDKSSEQTNNERKSAVVVNNLAQQLSTNQDLSQAIHISFQHPEPTPPDKPAELVSTALALIGRPTLHENEYLTPSMTKSRHEAERPFVKVLSSIYHNEVERKALSRYFMMWKEFALFVSLSQVLKSDKALLASTQMKLKERLNEGLSAEALKKRGEVMRAITRAFTEEYKSTGSLEQSFLRSFSETLPESLPDLPDGESVGSSLYGIYRFICGGLKGKCHDLE